MAGLARGGFGRFKLAIPGVGGHPAAAFLVARVLATVAQAVAGRAPVALAKVVFAAADHDCLGVDHRFGCTNPALDPAWSSGMGGAVGAVGDDGL